MEEKFQGWIVTLSNGDTVWETEPIPNELTPWKKLLLRLKEEDLKVTSLRVQRGRVTLHALPAKQCDGYYHAYDRFMSMISQKEYVRQGCGSVVGDKVFIQWIDPNGNIWSDIRLLEKEKVHTTIS